MKILVNNIKLPFTVPDGDFVREAGRRLGRAGLRYSNAAIYRRSVDARRRPDIFFVCSVSAELEEGSASDPGLSDKLKSAGAAALEPEIARITPDGVLNEYGTLVSAPREAPRVKLSAPPVIAGFGPCGMFAALVLAENGYAPLVLERGGDVGKRKTSVERFATGGNFDPECNVQFGAGGAGTFSDGKLTTRISDPRCRYILKRLCELGAPAEIMTEAKPHVGTDRLREIVKGISDRVRKAGGRIFFDTKLKGLTLTGGEASSLRTTAGEVPCGALVLATGHSARDTYAMLRLSGFTLAPKPFSVGARIEHRQEDIDRALYGFHAGDPRLGHADYAFSKRTPDGGCVYTFCMCPGGEVMAASSEAGGVVVNGMSRYLRDGVNANSAIVASVSPDDPVGFQRRLEEAAYLAGDKSFAAPAQTVGAFLDGNISGMSFTRVKPSYRGGDVRPYDLNKIFSPEVSGMLKLGIGDFDRQLRGFGDRSAVLTGVETRTSAPYRIPRGDDMAAEGFGNVYPCGEGAGWAGGIMSAAADGIRCAQEIMKRYLPAES